MKGSARPERCYPHTGTQPEVTAFVLSFRERVGDRRPSHAEVFRYAETAYVTKLLCCVTCIHNVYGDRVELL